VEATLSESSRYGAVALFLLALVFVFAAPLYWQHAELPEVRASESYENSDLYQFVYPAMHFAYARVRSGQLPLWNGRQMCGTPLLADHRIGLFQPLNAVFLLPTTERAMALHSFICLALMGIGFVLFGRSLDLAYGAALIGGVVYAFAGASAAAMSRPYLVSALAWLPFLFWAAREYTRYGRRGWALIAGLAATLFLFSGAYAIAALAAPLVAAFTVLHGITKRREEFSLRPALGGLALGAAIAVCLTGVQWIPTLAWAWSLDAPGSALWYLRSGGQLPGSFREALVQTFTARPGDLPRLCYVGMVPAILIPAAFFQRKQWRESVLFGVTGAACWLLGALGSQRIAIGLPREAFMYLAVFCIAVLSALGADRVLRPKTDYRSASVWPAAVLVFAALAGVFYIAGSQGRGYVIAFAVLLTPFLLLRKTWFAVMVACAMATLVFIDLTVANTNAYGHPYQDFRERMRRYRDAVELARERALGGRALVSSRPLEYGLPANLGMIVPIDVVGGRNLFATADQAAWWARLGRPDGAAKTVAAWDVSPRAVQPSLLNLMTAKVVLASPESGISPEAWGPSGPRLREVEHSGRGRVYVNESALPRIFWVPRWRLADTINAAMEALAEPDFNPARECVVDARHRPYLEQFRKRAPVPDDMPRGDVMAAVMEAEQVEPDAGQPASEESASAPRAATSAGSLEEISPERLVIHIEVPRAGVVVLSDSFAKGWRATLDGVPCEILRTNGLFRGIATPAGSHDIEFTYRPASLFMGIAVSLFGIALTAGLVLVSAYRRP
jgi:hypothetical protein